MKEVIIKNLCYLILEMPYQELLYELVKIITKPPINAA